MHYTSGKLTSVTDTYGRTLGLGYTGSLLTGLTTPDSANLTYGYVGFCKRRHLLSTVTYNTSPATHRLTVTSNTSFPTALTGITDENGHRYASWTYDSSGRARDQPACRRREFHVRQLFRYSGDRHVTGPLGITETYKFSILQGVPKVTEIDRAANGTVSSAARETSPTTTNGFHAERHRLERQPDLVHQQQPRPADLDCLRLRLGRQPHDQHHL